MTVSATAVAGVSRHIQVTVTIAVSLGLALVLALALASPLALPLALPLPLPSALPFALPFGSGKLVYFMQAEYNGHGFEDEHSFEARRSEGERVGPWKVVIAKESGWDHGRSS